MITGRKPLFIHTFWPLTPKMRLNGPYLTTRVRHLRTRVWPRSLWHPQLAKMVFYATMAIRVGFILADRGLQTGGLHAIETIFAASIPFIGNPDYGIFDRYRLLLDPRCW